MTTYVTQPWLPDRERLNQYIDGIYSRKLLTNNGPLVQTFTERLKAFLGVEHLLLVSNGTLALQIAYRALGIQQTVNGKPAEAITTPFSFVATASTLSWEGIKPVFCDIDPLNWCLDTERLGALVTPQTRAIVPVHVFGNSCDVEKIDQFARQHHLKVIYDGAHAFNVKYQDKSLLNWGDATTLSFHATKVFHSIEGGAVVFRNEDDLRKARELINFGITGPEQIAGPGINAKMNEFSAAMGLAMLDEIEQNFTARQAAWQCYQSALLPQVQQQQKHPAATANFAYLPVLLNSETQLLELVERLKNIDVVARRYFYPSLDSVAYLSDGGVCNVSRDIASRILCLPIYPGLEKEIIAQIGAQVNAVCGKSAIPALLHALNPASVEEQKPAETLIFKHSA